MVRRVALKAFSSLASSSKSDGGAFKTCHSLWLAVLRSRREGGRRTVGLARRLKLKSFVADG
jgi:hypothetical protein